MKPVAPNSGRRRSDEELVVAEMDRMERQFDDFTHQATGDGVDRIDGASTVDPGHGRPDLKPGSSPAVSSCQRSGNANTNRLFPWLGLSSGVRLMNRGVPVLTATYWRPSTA